MNFNYPLNLRFKLVALAPNIYVTDANGAPVFYIQQKALKFKEDVSVFRDDTKREQLFRIQADRVIDFSAKYVFTDQAGNSLGWIKHRGVRSIWKATYEVSDGSGQMTHRITEDNPWVKVIDSFAQEIPVVGMFTGYFFNPAFTVVQEGTERPTLHLTKQAAFFESSFTIEKLDGMEEAEELRLILALMMMVQLERSRG